MSSVNFKGAELNFDGTRVTMTTNRSMKILLGKTGFSIPVNSIQFVEFGPPSGLVTGYLRVNTGQPPLEGSAFDAPGNRAVKDPHSFHFTGRSLTPAVAKIRDEIEDSIRAIATGQGPGTASPVGPQSDATVVLKSLADLRDGGILSDLEFEAKKAEVLKRL